MCRDLGHHNLERNYPPSICMFYRVQSRAECQPLSCYGCPNKVIFDFSLLLFSLFCCSEYLAIQPKVKELQNDLLGEVFPSPSFSVPEQKRSLP